MKPLRVLAAACSRFATRGLVLSVVVFALALLLAGAGGAVSTSGSHARSARSAQSASYADIVLADSPAAYWRLGESSGSTAADASGHADNGTYLNSPGLGATGLLTGDANTAVTVNGTNQSVSTPANVLTLPSTSSAFSVEAWFETSASTGKEMIYSARSSGQQYAFIELYVSAGKLYGAIEANYSLNTYTVGGGSSVSDGLPHYVVFTRDTSGTMHLFLDGVEVNTATDNGPGNGASTGLDEQQIGADARDGNYFTGTIDEVAVYNSALDTAQVSAHYTAGAQAPTVPVSDGYSSAVLADSPAAYWRLGEPSGQRAIDSSSNGYPGAREMGVTDGQSSLLAGSMDTASGYDGVKTMVDTPSNVLTLPSTSSAFSVEAWFETSSATGTQTIYSARSSGDQYASIKLYISNGKLYGSQEANQQINSYTVGGASSVADGQPHYVVFTRDANATFHLYLDGVEVNTATDSGPGSGASTGLDEQRIGADARDGNYFSGAIDDVAVYSSALGTAQVSAHYTAGADAPTVGLSDGYSTTVLTDTPSAYWRLGEPSGQRAIDSSGNDLPGARELGVTDGQPSLLAGSTDTSSGFNGVSSVIDAPSNVLTMPSTTSAFSIEAWIKTSASSGTEMIYSARSSTDSTASIKLYLSGGKLYGYVQSNSEAYSYSVSGSTSVADGQPHYVVFTRAADDTMDIYLDGTKVATAPDGGPGAFAVTGLDEQRIGADARDGNYFSGTIDEVAVYQSALSADRVFAHYTAGGPGSGGSGGPSLPLARTFGDCSIDLEAINNSGCDPNVDAATGGFNQTITDLSLAGIGVPFQLTRSYNSLDTTAGGPLGTGWTYGYAASLEIDPSGDVVYRAGSGQELHFTKNADGSFTADPGGRATLTANGGGGYSLVSYDQIHYTFDSAGKLLSETDRNGEGLTFSYTGTHLTSATDSAGRVITFTYDPTSGLLTEVALPDGRNVQYGYTSGLLTSVTDVRGGTTTYSYDANDYLNKEVDQNNHTVLQNTYNATTGRITQSIDALNHTTTYSWSPSTQTETITDPRGKVWKETFSNNELIKRVDPLGDTTQYVFDSNMNETAVTDARNYTTTMTYDSRGNMLTRTAPAPLSYKETWAYDALNDVTSYTDGRGHTTTYGYDSAGNLTSKTQPGNITTSYGRDPGGTGLLVSVTGPRNKTTTYGYDSAHNLTSITSPLSEVTTMGYDSSGRMTSKVDPRGNVFGGTPSDYTTTYTYDNADNKLTETDPNGHTTTWVYDPAGNLSSVTDANNNETTYGYDAADELTSVTAPGNKSTTYGYDASANLTGRTDPNNHTTSWTYDAANRKSGMTDPLSHSWSYGYDKDGDLTTVTSPRGTTTYGFNALDRETSISYSDSTHGVTYSYDANGNRTQMVDGAGTLTYTYDNLDRLTNVTRGSNTFTYGYDNAGNLTSRTYPDNTQTTYTYDDDGRLATVTNGSNTTSYTYDAAGEPIQTTRPASNGWTETRAYDPAGQLTEIKDATGSSTLQQLDYSYDPAGNTTSLTGTDTQYYQYDNRNRLRQVCFDAPCSSATDTVSWTYDGVGNRLTETRPSGTTNYTYNAGDELTQAAAPGGTTTYSYNANGDQTAAGTTTYAYNLADQLTSATLSGATTNYTDDGDGNRLSSTTGSTTTDYLWDTNNPLPQLATETNGSGTTLRDYIQGLDTVALIEGGNTYYYHYNAIGSVTALTASNGSTEWTYRYEPFGDPKATTKVDPNAPFNPLRFTGEYLDSNQGLYDLRARQYDPTTGRFDSVDPSPAGPTSPFEAAYAYAAGNPVDGVDPAGTDTALPRKQTLLGGLALLLAIAMQPCQQNPLCLGHTGNNKIGGELGSLVHRLSQASDSSSNSSSGDPSLSDILDHPEDYAGGLTPEQADKIFEEAERAGWEPRKGGQRALGRGNKKIMEEGPFARQHGQIPPNTPYIRVSPGNGEVVRIPIGIGA
jgi:RHS repeat-associated protein